MSAGSARLYRGARVLSPEPAPEGVDAVATLGERIVAVGSVDDCRAALPESHEVIDVEGRTIVPGFVDAHLHPMVMCVFEQHLVLDQARSLADVLDAVADRSRSASSDETIVAFQLDDELLAERRLPTASELEVAGGGRAVVILRRDGHHAVGSTTALREAGLAAPGTDPPGGKVERDPTGVPTGLVREAAVAPLLGLMGDVSWESLVAGIDSWSARLVRQGVTSISAICQTTPEGPGGSAGELEAMGWSLLVDRVPFDVQTILIAPNLAAVHDARASGLHRPEAGRRVDAVKLFLDGTLGGRTACMHQPFTDSPDSVGLSTMESAAAYERMAAAHLEGLQVCVHAIGDRANHDAALLFARLLDEHPGPHRHRVEHASVLDHQTIELFAERGITTVVQPINLVSEQHWLRRRLGLERIERTYPFRALLDAGVTVAGSSDAPIESTDVLAAMGASVDRRGPGSTQALSALEAVRMYTVGGSVARNTEHRLGSIAVGQRADLVVLAHDPTVVEPHRIADIAVLATVIGGHGQYSHPDLIATPSGADR